MTTPTTEVQLSSQAVQEAVQPSVSSSIHDILTQYSATSETASLIASREALEAACYFADASNQLEELCDAVWSASKHHQEIKDELLQSDSASMEEVMKGKSLAGELLIRATRVLMGSPRTSESLFDRHAKRVWCLALGSTPAMKEESTELCDSPSPYVSIRLAVIEALQQLEDTLPGALSNAVRVRQDTSVLRNKLLDDEKPGSTVFNALLCLYLTCLRHALAKHPELLTRANLREAVSIWLYFPTGSPHGESLLMWLLSNKEKEKHLEEELCEAVFFAQCEPASMDVSLASIVQHGDVATIADELLTGPSPTLSDFGRLLAIRSLTREKSQLWPLPFVLLAKSSDSPMVLQEKMRLLASCTFRDDAERLGAWREHVARALRPPSSLQLDWLLSDSATSAYIYNSPSVSQEYTQLLTKSLCSPQTSIEAKAQDLLLTLEKVDSSIRPSCAKQLAKSMRSSLPSRCVPKVWDLIEWTVRNNTSFDPVLGLITEALHRDFVTKWQDEDRALGVARAVLLKTGDASEISDWLKVVTELETKSRDRGTKDCAKTIVDEYKSLRHLS